GVYRVGLDAVPDRSGGNVRKAPEAFFGEHEDRICASGRDVVDLERTVRVLYCRFERPEQVVLDRAVQQLVHIFALERVHDAVFTAEGVDLLVRFEAYRAEIDVVGDVYGAGHGAVFILVGARTFHQRGEARDVAAFAAGRGPDRAGRLVEEKRT